MDICVCMHVDRYMKSKICVYKFTTKLDLAWNFSYEAMITNIHSQHVNNTNPETLVSVVTSEA